MGKRGSNYVILLYLNFIVSLTGYLNYIIGCYLSFLYYCCFTCFVSILRLARPEVPFKMFLKFMRLTLSYSVW